MITSLVAVALCCISFPTKDELRQIALSNVNQIDHLKLAWVEKQSYVSGSLDSGIIEELRADVLCSSDFSRFILTQAHRSDGEKAMGPKYTTATDGTGDYYHWLPTMQAGTIARTPFAHSRDVSPVQAGELFTQAPSAEPTGVLALLDKGTVSGIETINGSSCAILEIRKNSTLIKRYWLALDKGCVPLKAELYGKGGEVASQIDLEVEQFAGAQGEHVWLPTSFTTLVKIDDALIKRTLTVDRNSVVINPEITPGTFRIEYPAGTRIADTTATGSAQFYKVDNEGTWIPIE